MIQRTPHPAFLGSLLQFTRDKNLKHGKALHAQILKTTDSTCIYLSNTLVNLYAKCGRLNQAHNVFVRMPDKDVVSYNCLINGYAKQGRKFSSSVLQLFRSMIGENTYPNAHTLSGVLTAASDLNVGIQVHGYVVKASCFGDVFVGSSLVNFYCKVGALGDARKVFDEMPERNSVTWSTLISGYAGEGNVGESVGLFESMRKDGNADVTEFVVTSVVSALTGSEFVRVGGQLHGLACKDGLLSIVEVGNAFVTMYSKCGSLDNACRLFEQSDDKNAITWSAMVTGLAQSGEARRALSLFSKMYSAGIDPSEFTFVGVLNACSDVCALEEGIQIHCYALKSGYGSQMYIMTALIDMYAKCGSTNDARKGFDRLQEPDIVLWTSMIAGHVQNGENEDALVLYGRMEMEGIMPNELTMSSVLKACANVAALEQGKQIHARTIKYGFNLEVPIGSAMSTMYSKCGNLEDGELVFRRIPARDTVCWNAMISGLSQNGCGKEALDLFEEMQIEGTKPDFVTFVNVLSACSHMGSVDKGWAYFHLMSDKYYLSPRVEHYACMVDILSRAGKLSEAKDFIESATVDHGLCLWRILLSAARNFRNYDIGIYAGEKLIELGSPESSAYVLLSTVYTALGQLDDVERVRRLMKLRGVSKTPGCSWIELKNRVHVFVVGDLMHPLIEDIRTCLQMLYMAMMDEGYKPSEKQSIYKQIADEDYEPEPEPKQMVFEQMLDGACKLNSEPIYMAM
ncbi:unnamed protein product [Rhodiola kirilowii]